MCLWLFLELKLLLYVNIQFTHPHNTHTHTHTHTHVHIGLKRDVDNEEQGPNRDTADFRIKKAQVLISNGFNRYPLLKVGKYE